MSQNEVGSVECGIDVKEKSYRKAVPFILSNVFFERLASGGSFAILAVFLNQKLDFDSDSATALFHFNELILYFFTIVFAIVADSWLGLFKTISYCTLLSALGLGIIAIVSIELSPFKVISLIGLTLYVVASGGIKSNQNVFGGNQFKLPEEESKLNSYFSKQYFVLKCGLVIGQALLPMLRNDVKCFGRDDCFPLAYGIASALLVLNAFIFWCGRSFYNHEKPSGNVCENGFVKVCGCCLTAVKQRLFGQKIFPENHWLDHAVVKYGREQVNDTKMAVNVLALFLSLPVFWSLYGQNNSRWVFQAAQMDGDVGFYTIKPDQMAMTTTLFTIVLIPIFEKFGYPLLDKFGIKTSLDRMALGFVVSAAAFLMAATVEFNIKTESINMLWMLPQYFTIAMSEVFIWVSALSFAYTQAPKMKSVITAFIYVTIGLGDLIVIVFSGSNMIDSQFYEFLFYVCLMIVNTACFRIASRKYKFVELK